MKLTLKIAATVIAGLIASSAAARDIEMQSIYPNSLPLLGQEGAELGGRVSRLTNDSLNLVFKNPGEIVAPNEVWDSISTGAIEAAWYSPGFAETVIPAAPLFTSFPFGPDVKEYTAWWYNGGGSELWAEITESYNVHTELCGVLVPEASGWFKEPVESIKDLKGKKMRIFGLGASVMQKLGVNAQSMSTGDTMSALNLGTIDMAEISFPAIDESIGMQEHAKHYYFPGWHQQTSLITLLVNQDTWDELEDNERAAIEESCAGTVARTTAAGEAIQLEPLDRLVKEHGVTIHKWSDEMLGQFEEAWREVVAEKSAQDADFARVWKSLQDFRAAHKVWTDLGYLK